MSPPRPGVRHTNQSKRLLDGLSFDDTSSFHDDLAGAQAYALLGIAEALGDIALTLRAIHLPDITNTLPTPKET